MIPGVERDAVGRLDRWAIEGATRVLLRWLKRADAKMIRVRFDDDNVVLTLAVGERGRQLDSAFTGLRKAVDAQEATA